MIGSKNFTIRVKTGKSWVRIDNVEICYYLTYRDFLSLDPDGVEIRYIQIPSWANCWKDRIRSYIEAYPKKLEDSIIEVD
jgi:hypothetical protein